MGKLCPIVPIIRSVRLLAWASQSGDGERDCQQRKGEQDVFRVVAHKGGEGAGRTGQTAAAATGTRFLAEKLTVGCQQFMARFPVLGQSLALTGQKCLKCGDGSRLPGQGDD